MLQVVINEICQKKKKNWGVLFIEMDYKIECCIHASWYLIL